MAAAVAELAIFLAPLEVALYLPGRKEKLYDDEWSTIATWVRGV